MKIRSDSRFLCTIIAIVFTLVSLQAYAGYMPKGWQAHPPYRIKPNTNGLLPSGLSPASVIKAYGFPANLQGLGQTVAIIDAMDNPNIEADLGVFSSMYGLPSCTTANGCFKKIYASGTPTGDPGWGVEIALDVEWVHAIAPLAKILLVEASDASNGLFSAINVAIENNATVISCSWGGAEYDGEQSFDSIFQNSPVPVVVSSGDNGHGVSYPASSPYVLSVGGTTLMLNSDGSYANEAGWSGSGGGLSAYETEPSYQASFPIPQDGGAMRGVPDVSYNADQASGVTVYDSYGQQGWMVVGGTSAGAPQWAALLAIANSAAGRNLTTANQTLYNAATSSYSTLYHAITSGTNGSCGYYCQTRTGYNYVTGLGSPQALALISFLTAGTQLIQLTNNLYNSEASTAGVTPSSALVQLYTGSSVLCDSRTVAYQSTLTIQPGMTGSVTGHTTCTSNQKITSVSATPIIANTAVGAIFTASPVSFTVTNSTGISLLSLKMKPANGSDYAPVFDATNGVIVTSGTPTLVSIP